MAIKYQVTRVQNTVYLDNAGKAVQGFTVSVALPELAETIDIKVPSIDAKIVAAEIDTLITNREALSKLGSK